MKLNRTENSIKSIITGFINKVLTLILPFLVRTIFIKKLGVEYLGINSLMTSILSVLNIAELGVGSAIVFAMYKAIANDDEKLICGLVNYYKKVYRIIGTAVLIIGLAIMPFINYFSKGDIPLDINIYMIYLLYLINTVLSYFLFSYKTSLLQAHQKNYIINNINSIVKVLLNILQIVFLLMKNNYYIYIIIISIMTILENLINAYIVNRKYPQYRPIGEIEDEERKLINKKVSALFFYKLGGIVLNSVDSIVISRFLGLTILGKYNNYYYVLTTLFGFLEVLTSAMLAGIGNSIETESVEKNYKDFRILNFIQSWIIVWCSASLIVLYQPFMQLWLGSENLLDYKIIKYLIIYFYVWKMMDIINLYKAAVGLWEFDKFRPIIASIANLIINIVLVQFIGIYGIIISTIISIVIIIFPWSSFILFREYFKNKYKNYLFSTFNTIVKSLIIVICTYIISKIINLNNKYIEFIIKTVYCIIIPNILFYLLNIKNINFIDSINWLKSKIKTKS